MLEVKDMSRDEMIALLLRCGVGHLGCVRDEHPYVVPMNYAFDSRDLYFFTTEGTKTEFIAANHEVCFQVEEVADSRRWASVQVFGRAERLSSEDETEEALRIITERNPTLQPALSDTKIGAWHRLRRVVVYRLSPTAICGRKTA